MYDFNPYEPPLAIHEGSHKTSPLPPEEPHPLIRIVAGLLAIGGVLWGIFFAMLIVVFGWPLLLIGLPGYLVTYGYLYRASRYPSFAARRTIWIASLLVQGGWLAFALVVCGPNEFLTRTFGILCVAWWAFATGISAFGLLVDCKPEPRREPLASRQ